MTKLSEKLLKVLMQYYTTPRYVDINGKAYDEIAKVYQPKAVENVVDFNMVVTTTRDTPVFRQMQDDLLFNLLNSGQITLDLFLDNSSLPFAKKLSAQVKNLRESQQNGQMDAALLEQLQQQASANADPRTMAMLQRAVS